MNRLLLDERPLFVLPSLAERIGLNEAIALQQIHWMTGRESAVVQKGRRWIQQSVEELSKFFPFWSESTIKRTLADLKDAGYLLSERTSGGNMYAVVLEALGQVELADGSHRPDASGQVDPSPCKREVGENRETLFDIGPMSDAKSTTPAPVSTPDYMQQVWDHYLELFEDRVRIKELTDRRRKMIERAFKAAGGTPEKPAEAVQILKDAISGLASYRKSGQSSSTNVDLSVIFETGPHAQSNLTDQIEWWARQSESIGTGEASMPSITRAKITSRKVEVVQMLKMPNNEGAQARGAEALAWLKENHNLTYRLVDPDSPLTSRVEWIVET